MIQSGKYLEEIIEMLSRLQSEIQTANTLGLINISKHSENFVRTLLNLIYNYELENLNKEKANFPGLDLGDKAERIAYQVTAQKKSEKIDDTLNTCIKYEHYKVFSKIKILILTSKQNSYSLKTITEPHFSFDPNIDIIDFNMLIKEIENLPQFKIESINKFIKAELNGTIESIKNDENEIPQFLLNPGGVLNTTKLKTYSVWNARVVLKSEKINVPKIHSKLRAILNSDNNISEIFVSIFNEQFLQKISTNELLYLNEIKRTHVQNYCYGFALKIEPSSITIEKANYTDDIILIGLKREMQMLLISIICLSSISNGNFEIELSTRSDKNTEVSFFTNDSIVLQNAFTNYVLETQSVISETITNIHTSTLADLLQSFVHIFISDGKSFLANSPFIEIDRQFTEANINNLKKHLNKSI
ncbi:SMEK domain-containing protein [Chryseobacterium sp. Marseille-Q3244]|uniref:SMEK domain-containing protein n=1 Tax=Chryseobacterium sp. Marseille-Q3244 TaxID=2758092 RepID=UPI0020259CF7|nr:SMEK domain-containing protein [Chryseobacterium sp. Marseille-Q3244]